VDLGRIFVDGRAGRGDDAALGGGGRTHDEAAAVTGHRISGRRGRRRRHRSDVLYRERKAYLAGVQDALVGVEEARVVLAGVVRRIDGK
jgi:hypothetical protein